ncbi:unnamed protein product [Brassicogethes aeneus]|uniref:CIDE-N domain-containing protein n=1 Tax=Brassicogethes aeneus TaxID=1431903 RepID=A0A9P0BHS9_BRAAE|nr:unnamed protein product [Brassicogethes aeneus]
MSNHVFKVWSQDRQRKTLALVTEPNIYTKLILKASEKLQIDGTSLVLNSDGTELDDEDEILIEIKKETLILLKKNEQWSLETHKSDTSLATTATISSNTSSKLNNWLHNTDDVSIVHLETEEIQNQSVLLPLQEISPIINLEITNDCNMELLWANYGIKCPMIFYSNVLKANHLHLLFPI